MKNLDSIKTNLSAKEYDISNADNEIHGFYEWNKPKFFMNNKAYKDKELQEIKEKTGILPDEIWCLDTSICLFILPRLKLYREKSEKNVFHPAAFRSSQEWLDILDKMIFSFEEHLNCNAENNHDKKYQDQVLEGLLLFAKYFGMLWI